MSKAAWYWHRLCAMSPGEILRRVHNRITPNFHKPFPIHEVRDFPAPLPRTKPFPPRDWKAFGKLPITVDDPPRWNYDYLARLEVPPLRKLNYRQLPGGADIKMIWELSRWHELARMAQSGQKEKCTAWLEDWCNKNPPFRGWNWTSALESGIRLIHLAWIDAFLGRELEGWESRIVPDHVYFTWTRRSFGSSANNHLLGELAGMITAVVRWPEAYSFAAPLERLQRDWEREVLAQFAEDGGNREQALNYHLFSLDLCQLTRAALLFSGRKIAPAVEERLAAAEAFYAQVQVQGETWDYGDSDDGTIFGAPVRQLRQLQENQWHYFAATGIARQRSGAWELRWDLSPLGYLKTAAHGHLDALHLSLWWNGMAVVIDPGTGAYYGDPKLRNALAGWDAHNGPHLPDQDSPKRLGPFLWSGHHEKPTWHDGTGKFQNLSRRVSKVDNGWQVEDSVDPHQPFIVRWQFAPGAQITTTGKQTWRLKRQDGRFDIQVSGGAGQIGDAVVSPGFRQTAQAPFLELKTGSEACVLRTKILLC